MNEHEKRPARRIFLAAGAVLGGTVTAINASAQTSPAGKHKVVFHVAAPVGFFNNVNNIIEAFKADGGVQVDVVFNGQGLNMLVKAKSEYETQLKAVADKGVKLSACQNSMKRLKVTTEELFPFAAQVDSGVAELVRKQESGWAYIKAGE
jgi:intracellular sulfur oxidation DsrE/DsrF family protein